MTRPEKIKYRNRPNHGPKPLEPGQNRPKYPFAPPKGPWAARWPASKFCEVNLGGILAKNVPRFVPGH